MTLTSRDFIVSSATRDSPVAAPSLFLLCTLAIIRVRRQEISGGDVTRHAIRGAQRLTRS
jgi:hypothetical protein